MWPRLRPHRCCMHMRCTIMLARASLPHGDGHPGTMLRGCQVVHLRAAGAAHATPLLAIYLHTHAHLGCTHTRTLLLPASTPDQHTRTPPRHTCTLPSSAKKRQQWPRWRPAPPMPAPWGRMSSGCAGGHRQCVGAARVLGASHANMLGQPKCHSRDAEAGLSGHARASKGPQIKGPKVAQAEAGGHHGRGVGELGAEHACTKLIKGVLLCVHAARGVESAAAGLSVPLGRKSVRLVLVELSRAAPLPAAINGTHVERMKSARTVHWTGSVPVQEDVHAERSLKLAPRLGVQ